MFPLSVLAPDPLLGLDSSGVVLCASWHGQGPHPAHWYATCPCGHTTPICDQRKRILYAEGGWKCQIARGGGCTAYHPWEHVGLHRL